MLTFDQIKEVNEGLNGIDFKGKNYVMVNSRVTAFRQLFPEGFITTDILSLENGVVVMKARAGYYEGGKEVVLATGLACEKEQTSYINKTSFVENCETSAVGRCLGFLAIGNDDSICSAEELVNAIKTQEQIKQMEKAAPESGQIEKVDKVPEPKPNPTANFIRNEISDIQEKMGLKTYQEARAQVMAWVDELVKGGAINPVNWVIISLTEAKAVFEAIRKTFKPGEAA